jgi:hypothetical protein
MPPANAAPLCVMGVCDHQCVSPFIECTSGCVDTKTDPLNCGLCGRMCAAGSNATPVCVNSNCTFVCNQGFSLCGNNCVDTDTNKNNCGLCGNKCHGMSMCVNGSCT